MFNIGVHNINFNLFIYIFKSIDKSLKPPDLESTVYYEEEPSK